MRSFSFRNREATVSHWIISLSALLATSSSAFGWMPTPSTWRFSSCLFSSQHDSAQSRRQFLAVGTIGAASCLTSAGDAWASSAVVSSPATCDATVTVWKRGDRLVYLLGTAHISQSSADLAADLVKNVHPDAVFIELDLKRIAGGQLPSSQGPVTSSLDIGRDDGGQAPTEQKTKIIVPTIGRSATPSLTSSPSPDGDSSPAPALADQTPKGGIGKKLLGFGAAAVGSAIRGMYKNLGDSGFKPGEEFIMAVQEGRNQGADIVLGDQDVEVTLNRMTQALAVTDLNKLLDPDSDLERGMNELLGQNPQKAETSEQFKSELSNYVEKMKTRESVTKIMGDLKQVAPALVQVMITERDAYMSAGLDSLNDYEVITAVMGIAHVDGVERNLQAKGWTQTQPNCPRR